MSMLNSWLDQATRGLSAESAARVRSEIEEHYDAGRQAAVDRGATLDEAGRIALATLGDPRLAGKQYQRVLLTSAEAGLLREGNWEARIVCSRIGLKWQLLAMPVAALVASIACFCAGAFVTGRVLLIGGIGLGLFLLPPFLPIYTPRRARLFRALKWIALAATLVFALGPDLLGQFWLFASCFWAVAWIEWKRVSLRRKLPVARWPKQLYL